MAAPNITVIPLALLTVACSAYTCMLYLSAKAMALLKKSFLLPFLCKRSYCSGPSQKTLQVCGLIIFRYFVIPNNQLEWFCEPQFPAKTIEINGTTYTRDKWTNISPNILKHLNRNLLLQYGHPLSLLRQNIVNFIYKLYPNNMGNPLFSIYDNISPIVSIDQNFNRCC